MTELKENKEKKEKVVKKSDVSREEFDNLAAKVRIMSDNWHKYAAKYLGGGAKNGAIEGSAKISGLITIALAAMVTVVLGAGEILNYSSPANGVIRINRVSAGVNSMEADSFIGDVTGDITGDITGDVAGNIDAATAVKLNIGIATANAIDIGKTTEVITLLGPVNTDEAVTMDTTLGVTGVTTLGSDCSIAGNGTVTSNLTVSLVVDADSVTVDAAGAGLDVQSTGKLNVGTATADAIDIGKTTEVITLLGPVNTDEAVTMDTTLGVTGIATLSSDCDIGGNATVASNLVVTGDITAANLTTTTDTAAGHWNVTSNLIVTGTSDTTSITVDAGEGIDVQSAGTLEIGVLTANQINVGITAVETDILGTLNVTEAASFDAVATFDVTPVFSTEAAVDGKWAVVGPDASAGLMVLGAAITSTSDTLQTNAFATAFGGTPVVTVSYDEDPGGAEAPWVVSVNSTTLVVTTVADKDFSYIAVGARP